MRKLREVGGGLRIWRGPRLAPQPRQTPLALDVSHGIPCPLLPTLLGLSPLLTTCQLSPKSSLSCGRQVNHSRAKSSPGWNIWEQGESWNCDHEHPMASHFPGEEITRTAPRRCEHQSRQFWEPLLLQAPSLGLCSTGAASQPFVPCPCQDTEALAASMLCRAGDTSGVQPSHVQPPHTPRVPAVPFSLCSSSPPRWELTAAGSHSLGHLTSGLSWCSPREQIPTLTVLLGTLLPVHVLSDVLPWTHAGWHSDQPPENPWLANVSTSSLGVSFILILYSYSGSNQAKMHLEANVQLQILSRPWT